MGRAGDRAIGYAVLGAALALAAALADTPAPVTAQSLPPEQAKAQADVRWSLGNLAWSTGNIADAERNYTEALRLFRIAGDRVGEGRSLSALGSVAERRGQLAEAQVLYDQALSVERAAGDRFGEGRTLSNLGSLAFARGEHARAVVFFQQALVVERETGDREAQIFTLRSIGVLFRLIGRYRESLDALQEALAIVRDTGNRRELAAVLNQYGQTLQQTGQYARARELYAEALSAAREHSNRADEAVALAGLGQVQQFSGQYEQARDYFHQALAIVETLNATSMLAQTLIQVGRIETILGRYPRALEHTQRALDLAREGRDRFAEAAALLDIGVIHARQGQLPQALAYARQSLGLRYEIDDRPGEAATLRIIGETFSMAGRHQNAIDSFQQALAIFREMGARANEGVVLSLIGGSQVAIGDYDAALASFQHVLDITRETGDLPTLVTTSRNLARLRELLGRPDVALQDNEGVLPVVRGLGNRPAEAEILSTVARLQVGVGRYDEGIETSRRALALAREVGDRTSEAWALFSLAAAERRQGKLEEALSHYEGAIALSESRRLAAGIDEFRTGIAEQDIAIYREAVLTLHQLGRPAEAFQTAERARARTFLDQLKSARPETRAGTDSRPAEEEAALRARLAALDTSLRAEQAKPAAQRNAEAVSTLRADLERAHREYDQLLAQLKATNPEYASLVSVDPLSAADVQSRLDNRTTLVSYFLTPEKRLAFVLTRDSVELVELPASAAELRDALDRFRAFADRDAAVPAASRELYDLLVAPVREKIRTPVAGIVPHDALHYVPFAALHDGRRYLGEDLLLFELPSASALPFIQENRKPLGSVLPVAQGRAEGFPVLRHAGEEARSVARLAGTQPLVDGEATETAVRERARDFSVLHVAAHAELNPHGPLFSRLLLAGDDRNDGSLSVREVYGLDLDGTDLVVLSACETQLGAQSRGDDLVGLGRAFIYAGASSVVASLWKVDDEATNVFMTSFYKHLKDGESKAAALQAAQRETRAKYPNPYYWAAFVLTGDPGPTDSAGRSASDDSGRTAAIAAGGILLAAVALGGFWWLRRQGAGSRREGTAAGDARSADVT